ncbi:putative methyltransferase DDB_G0268948 isoform X1 [Vidua chalybeata]|nr:putative methyltransferase DDB_G0268948 isoform X1 [Vidua chalybeata]
MGQGCAGTPPGTAGPERAEPCPGGSPGSRGAPLAPGAELRPSRRAPLASTRGDGFSALRGFGWLFVPKSSRWLGKREVPGQPSMATQMFEGRGHAAVYQKYRFAPGKELQQTILSYLREKKAIPAELAVDVGCGSGQGTHFLGEHFKKVVGTDISEAQIQEAKDTPCTPNISYLVCPAEELPFRDGSVDVLASFTAAHWFDVERFMREAQRVLRPGGCVAISTYTLDMSLRYGGCSQQLTKAFRECWDKILKYSNNRVKYVLDDYKEIFEALPFPDKKRVTDIYDPIPMTVEGVVGYMESTSSYQTFKKNDPTAATSLLQETEKRMLETMGVSSRETPVEFWVRHVCVLGCKGC